MDKDYYEVDQFKFCASELECHTYEDDWFKGIVYDINGILYDIFLNKCGMARILIKHKIPKFGEETYKDLPLNEKTIKLLPDCIKVEKIK